MVQDRLDVQQTMQAPPRGEKGAAILSPDQVIGQYRIIRLLGRGGMGEVYEAENTINHRRIALKVLARSATAENTFLDRFRVESRVMMDLTTPIFSRFTMPARNRGSNRVRLPSEAEWMTFAQCGDGREYPSASVAPVSIAAQGDIRNPRWLPERIDESVVIWYHI